MMTLAMSYCQEKGWNHLYLWTVDKLSAARHLYAKFGFLPTETKLNTEWTSGELTEERWDFYLHQ